MTDYRRLIEEYGRVQVGIDGTESLKLMKLKRLDCIAESLKGIEDKLDSIDDSLKELNSCIGYVPPNYYHKEGYHIIRIGGSIDAGNY